MASFHDLTTAQLRPAVQIREQIEAPQAKFDASLSGTTATAAATKTGRKKVKVGGYLPINEGTLDFFEDCEQLIEFADDGSESPYLIDPTQEDPFIIVYDLETSDLQPTGVTLSAFLSAPRFTADDFHH